MTQPVGWTPTPDAVAKRTTERSDRDETLALEVLKQAVANAKDQNKSAQQIAADAETMWQWVTTDTWPPKQQGAP